MKSQDLSDSGGLDGGPMITGPSGREASPDPPEPAESPDAEEAENNWQRHVMTGIWICLALATVITAALLYARAHGHFGAPRNRTAPPPPWPEGS